jgi:hypothetical protein
MMRSRALVLVSVLTIASAFRISIKTVATFSHYKTSKMTPSMTIQGVIADTLVGSVFKIRPLFLLASASARKQMIDRVSYFTINRQMIALTDLVIRALPLASTGTRTEKTSKTSCLVLNLIMNN